MPFIPVLGQEQTEKRRKFFEAIFVGNEGFICIARRHPDKNFEERFFRWPEDSRLLLGHVEESVMHSDVWYCPMLFSGRARTKLTVLPCPFAWADLDTCPPEKLLVQPTLLTETSPGRYQALWRFNELVETGDAEEISRAIAYYHAADGADKSGWDLTQLLRVPYTSNHKYSPPAIVQLVSVASDVTFEQMRAAYPVVADDGDAIWPFPEFVPDGQELFQAYLTRLNPKVFELITVRPQQDWSKSLWQLEMLLAEHDMTREEIFALARMAACNKYARDGVNEKMLWKEVCKAWVKHRERSMYISDATTFKTPELLTDEDHRAVEQDRTFIDDYVAWAKTVGDAAEAYHHAGAFICLSALLSGALRLPTSFGLIVPNLWFLLLADTTLTRKSTALDLAVDMLVEVDDNLILATDGSIEGLFTALSNRSGIPSIFLRDEFSGLLEAMTKRDIYAGMGESFTKMYDGKMQKRVLRRETIEVRDPIFIIFAGGIRTKILNILTDEQITSGFLPRFIFVTAQSDINRLQPLGPPNAQISAERGVLVQRLRQFRTRYQTNITVKISGVDMTTKNVIHAQLTPGAWALYNSMEKKLLETGVKDLKQELLTPVMDRLAKSGLKAAVLLAGSRLPDRLVVEERDIFKAFSYVGKWREYAMDVIASVGLSNQERVLAQVQTIITRRPGVLRSTVMSSMHLSKYETDSILDTLEQRGKIERVKNGKTEKLNPVIMEDA